MSINIINYFETTILPMIRIRYPEVFEKIGILILGSVGLGNDDQFSDLEAGIYLNDNDWKQYGGQLQLALNDCLLETNPWRKEGSVLSVYPISWLLDGQAEKYLLNKNELPWDLVSFETLFTIQENLILHDPQGMLKNLKEATVPSLFPLYLWKKALISELYNLGSDFSELELSLKRNKMGECHILLGYVLERLFHIGFLLCRQYYPWRTHLRWAFDKLPEIALEFGFKIDLILATDWHKKVEMVGAVIAAYKDYIVSNSILPEIDFYSIDLNEELLWAMRLQAWENPNWRNWITDHKSKAVKSGYSPNQFWVWSLWGWEDEVPNKNIKKKK